jgi:hypothetical protein
MLYWLRQEGGNAKKHQEWWHPTAVYLIHHTIVTVAVFWGHDLFVARDCEGEDTIEYQLYRHRQELCTILTGIYAVLQLVCRLWQTTSHRTRVLYEGTWLCNTTLVIGSLALWYRRPLITTAFCLTVGIDQLLWYVDIVGWLATGRFPVDAVKYLTWPSNPWVTRLTCTYHVWTIPVFLCYVAAPLQYQALWLSGLIMVLHVSLSRLLTPFHLQGNYLNVNLSYELWKDIKIEFLRVSRDNPPARVYLFRLLWRWQGFNVLVYLVLSIISRHIILGDVPQRLC